MKTNVKQWRNSIAIRIPKPDLNALLEKVTNKNIHRETNTGAIKGKEIW